MHVGMHVCMYVYILLNKFQARSNEKVPTKRRRDSIEKSHSIDQIHVSHDHQRINLAQPWIYLKSNHDTRTP